MLQRMLNRLRGANDDEKGFTLIELLVVILIIGILAAIALPTFLGQRDKASDSSAKSDVRNAVTQIESCIADKQAGDFATCTNETGGELAGVVPESVVLTAAPATNGTYTLNRKSDSDTFFTISKSAPGSYSRSCGSTASATSADFSKGGCTDGKW